MIWTALSSSGQSYIFANKGFAGGGGEKFFFAM